MGKHPSDNENLEEIMAKLNAAEKEFNEKYKNFDFDTALKKAKGTTENASEEN